MIYKRIIIELRSHFLSHFLLICVSLLNSKTTSKRTFIKTYTYNASKDSTNTWIKNLVKEGTGIISIARLLKISVTTVLSRIISIAKTIRKSLLAYNKTYEVDELRTFYKSKTRLGLAPSIGDKKRYTKRL